MITQSGLQLSVAPSRARLASVRSSHIVLSVEHIGPRRLTVVLAADIAGYSRLMHADERGTHARVRGLMREVVLPSVAEHRGQVNKTSGDGFLASFESPVEAVRCAIVIQQSMVGRNLELPRPQLIQYRIGVNLGDVFVESGDIYGEGVNIAARLEQLAEPGSVYISGAVYEQVKNKLVCSYKNLGDRKVKNITEPVTIYHVLPDRAALKRATRWPKAMLALTALIIGSGVGGAWYAWQLARKSVSADMPFPAAPTKTHSTAETVPAVTSPPPPTRAANPGATSPAVTTPPQPAPNATALSQPAPPGDASKEGKVAMTMVPLLPPSAKPAAPPAPSSPVARQPDMVFLPGGRFRMGSRENPSEEPAHFVQIRPFWISKYPVTVSEWHACVAGAGCKDISDSPPGSDQPMANVSWRDAVAYVTWLARTTGLPYRLPSEAEWEYGARAGSTTRYWWGNEVGVGHANCHGCGSFQESAGPLKVGGLAPNQFGLFDMGGGVSEWVADCWHDNYVGAPTNGAAWECQSGGDHVLRGGSWMSTPSIVRVADREHYETDVRYPGNGFRVARSQ
jgi:formylglycine-generating enzyme required for sulfatase activity/class 3 adenylate cyclase